MASLFFEIVGHFTACGLFITGLAVWWVLPVLFGRAVFFPGIVIRVLWAAAMSFIISPALWITVSQFTLLLTAFLILPLLSEVILDELHVAKHWFDSEPPIAELDDDVSWEYVARLKSSNNGYDSEQFYPVTMVDFSEIDDPFWPHASSAYMVEIRRRCLVWRTISIWQVSALNGKRQKIHTFHDFCQWTDTNWFGRQFWIQDCWVNCFQTNGIVLVHISYCGECKLYVHDIAYRKSNTVKIRDHNDLWCPVSITCLGRLVNIDGAVEGWRTRWVAADGEIRDDDTQRAHITQKVLDLRCEHCTTCRSHEELIFGRFGHVVNLSYVRNSRGHFGVAAMGEEEGEGDEIMVFYDPVTGKYNDRCISEEELKQWDRPYKVAVSTTLFNRRPIILTDRECITSFDDGTVLRAQFAAPTLKYQTGKKLFRANPSLQNQMNSEHFRQFSGIEGMGGHFR